MITIMNDFIYAAISQIYEEDGEVRVNRFQLSLRLLQMMMMMMMMMIMMCNLQIDGKSPHYF